MRELVSVVLLALAGLTVACGDEARPHLDYIYDKFGWGDGIGYGHCELLEMDNCHRAYHRPLQSPLWSIEDNREARNAYEEGFEAASDRVWKCAKSAVDEWTGGILAAEPLHTQLAYSTNAWDRYFACRGKPHDNPYREP